MAKLLFNVTWDQGKPTIEQVAARYGFDPTEIDAKFGVIEIDPEEHLYTILVDREAAERVRGERGPEGAEREGPFANPPVQPFGPPKA